MKAALPWMALAVAVLSIAVNVYTLRASRVLREIAQRRGERTAKPATASHTDIETSS